MLTYIILCLYFYRDYALLVKDEGLVELSFENLIHVGGNVRIHTPSMCYPNELGLRTKFKLISGAILDGNVLLANRCACSRKYF